MKKINSLKNRIKKNLFIGGFAFFFIKGLVWLFIFFLAALGLININ